MAFDSASVTPATESLPNAMVCCPIARAFVPNAAALSPIAIAPLLLDPLSSEPSAKAWKP